MNAISANHSGVYAESFDAFVQARATVERPWVRKLRGDALARFACLGVPSQRLEEWRFTSLAPLAQTSFQLASPAARPRPLPSVLARLPAACRLVFVDGHFVEELSSGLASSSVRVQTLAQAFSEDSEWLAGALRLPLEQSPDPRFWALNTAFAQDGAVLRIPRGVAVEGTVFLHFYQSEAGVPLRAHPRIVVHAEEGSRVSLVESHLGAAGKQPYFANPATQIETEAGAQVEHVRVVRGGASEIHVGMIDLLPGAGAQLSSTSFIFGGHLVRTDLRAELACEGAEVQLGGLSLAAGEDHLDQHVLVQHLGPRSTSRQLYKATVDGAATGIFKGKVLVSPHAHRTQAILTSRNLILSERAAVHALPHFEIYADEVNCTHGATVGQLEEAQLFYLRARGLSKEAAEAMLSFAFASEVLQKVRSPALREALETEVLSRLAPQMEALR